ncbi:hypothetical protein H5410_013701, partial [Solanum commersonii]
NSDIQRREEPWKIFQRYLVNGLYFPGESYKTINLLLNIIIKSSPSSSRSSYGSSSSSTPIIQKGGMSLYNLNSRAQERASSSIHLEDIPESDPLYAKLQEFITQKQGDSFASIAKEEVDDIKTYEKVEKREMIFLLENSTSERVRRTLEDIPEDIIQVRMFITSKMIIKHIIHIEDWAGGHTLPTIKILQPFHKLYKEWVKVSPDLNKLYHQEHICYFQQIEADILFIEFYAPWIHKWVPK